MSLAMRRDSIRYTRSADGIDLAWAVCGVGPKVLVVPPNAITDIARDWENPIRGPLIAGLAAHFRVIRFDQRGCGSSQREIERQSLEAWIEDIEAVVAAAGLDKPFAVFGVSQGAPASAAYVARHPDRVSHFVAYGASRRGLRATGNPGLIAYHEARTALIRQGLDAPHPGARMLLASEMGVDLGPEAFSAVVAHLRRAVSGADAARLLDAAADVDVRDILAGIRTPTLVMHTAEVVGSDVKLGRNFASSIPGAEYIQLPGHNHILTPQDPAHALMLQHIAEFVHQGRGEDPLSALSPRERDILDGVCAGLSNEAIALQRHISAKTVRNHLTQIFDKLGVMTRTQAAVLATEAARTQPSA